MFKFADMKSLYDLPKLENNSVFTDKIYSFIQKEGFKLKKNNSYCFKDYQNYYNLDWEDNCYYNHVGSTYYLFNPIMVYIFKSGIGIDINCEDGENLTNRFIKFSDDSENAFEEAYDKMVDIVNESKYR